MTSWKKVVRNLEKLLTSKVYIMSPPMPTDLYVHLPGINDAQKAWFLFSDCAKHHKVRRKQISKN